MAGCWKAGPERQSDRDAKRLYRMMQPTVQMDFSALDQLSVDMQDNAYVEYIFHKLFDNPEWTWEQAVQCPATWNFPECWRARYWLYFQQHQQYLKDARILDLGSNMNFYSAWALLNGAAQVTAVEPDVRRCTLGQEYAKIRNLDHRLHTLNLTIDDYVKTAQHSCHDVVFFMDVMYYLNNGIDILALIQSRVKPKYMFLESTVVEDHSEHGHYEVWYPSIDSKTLQSFSNDTQTESPLALLPSRLALYNTIIDQGWQIISYYDYKDFVGHGESPPRRSGRKDFYLLKNTHQHTH